MFVVLTYEANECIVHGPFETVQEAEKWAANWYGDPHWSVESLRPWKETETVMVPPKHYEGDCC